MHRVKSLLVFFVVGIGAAPATMQPVSSAPSQTGPSVPSPIAPAQEMSGQATVTNAPFTLTAVLDKTVTEGQQVTLALALSSTESFITSSADAASSFQITVTDNAGHTVKRTSFGDWVLTPPTSGSNIRSPVDPGQIVRYRYNLARLFDLSRPGDYAVHVARGTLVLPPLTVRLEENPAEINGPMP